MPNKRMIILAGNVLNDSNDTVASGLTEPITGLEEYNGLVLGDYYELTTAEALLYSNTTVGTLFAGTYQRVFLNASAVSLKRGQLLFWVQNGTFKHEVTNVEPADLSVLAGIFINADDGVTAGNFFYMQALAPGKATVLFKTALTGVPAVGQAVYAAGAGVGADNARADVLDGIGNPTFTQAGNMQARFLGTALQVPVGGALKQVAIQTNKMIVD